MMAGISASLGPTLGAPLSSARRHLIRRLAYRPGYNIARPDPWRPFEQRSPPPYKKTSLQAPATTLLGAALACLCGSLPSCNLYSVLSANLVGITPLKIYSCSMQKKVDPLYRFHRSHALSITKFETELIFPAFLTSLFFALLFYNDKCVHCPPHHIHTSERIYESFISLYLTHW